MYLQKLIFVNWGNLPNSECEFGPVNLLSGGNGSGKTTAADAIQTIMTAAHDTLYHFNPGQDESSQRGRGGKQIRTLASYVLGCDDGAYARPHTCDGYLAAVFAPTPGEDSETFSVLLGMRASLDESASQRVARLDHLQFYLMPGTRIAIGDLIREDKAGQYVVPSDRIYKNLSKQFGKTAVEPYERKKSYLCRFYALLKGKRDAISERAAMNAARAFSRFMAYKPIKSIDDFVAREVLEPRDLGEAIRHVSGMLKRIHTMESDARRIRDSVERLCDARDSAEQYIDNWLALQILDYQCARARYNDSQGRYVEAKRQQLGLREAIRENRQSLDHCDARREALQQTLFDLNTRRLGVPALREKDTLAKEKQSAEQTLVDQIPALAWEQQTLEDNLAAAKQLEHSLKRETDALDGASRKALIGACQALAQTEPPVDIQQLLNSDWIDIQPLEAALDSAGGLQQRHNELAALCHGEQTQNQPGLRDALVEFAQRQQQTLASAKKSLEQCERDIQRLDASEVRYPKYVQAALALINDSLPEADARVLCDHVEITDDRWQAAIEGYLGNARFGLIVAPEYEAAAIKLLRNSPPAVQRARIIQGDKARRDLERLRDLPADSIVHLMDFSHDTARDYLTASYGTVVQVEDAEQLRRTRRGVTANGLGSGNYALFRCEVADADLVFGHSARARALRAREIERDSLQTAWQAAHDRAGEAARLLDCANRLSRTDYADNLGRIIHCQRQIRSLDAELGRVDVTEHDEIEAELGRAREDDQKQLEHHRQLSEERIDLEAQKLNSDKRCQELDREQDQNLAVAEQCEQALTELESLWPDFDSEQRLAYADEECQQHDQAYFRRQRPDLEAALKAGLAKARHQVLTHNQSCDVGDGMAFEVDYADELGRGNFQKICGLRRQFDALYNRDKNHILASRTRELESLRESFNNAFVTNLCHSIYQAINDGKKTLEALNRELEHHRFGVDRERYRFDWEWVPEFKDYWQFFKAVIDNPAIGDGQTLFDIELSARQQKVRERLMNMLLDEDEHKALRELARIADYRNYRRYEIFKEPEGKPAIALSKYGTGSGGQLETPAYIIRSAAITSAFGFNEGTSHLRMVLVDEAFSKMDEHRSREVIEYLTDTLGLQLLFIMPSSKSGPFLDIISNQFVFSKCPVATPVGELKSRVLLDRQICNREQIRELVAQHRQSIRQQAELDFLEEVEA